MELARVQIRNVQFLNGLIRRVFNVKVARGSWKKGNRARRLQYLKTCLVHTAGALRRLGGWRGGSKGPCRGWRARSGAASAPATAACWTAPAQRSLTRARDASATSASCGPPSRSGRGTCTALAQPNALRRASLFSPMCCVHVKLVGVVLGNFAHTLVHSQRRRAGAAAETRMQDGLCLRLQAGQGGECGFRPSL